MVRARQWGWIGLCLGCCLVPATAEDAWTASPYRVHVWLAWAPDPELAALPMSRWRESIQQVAEMTYGAAWDLTVDATPRSLHAGSQQTWDWCSLPILQAEAPELLEHDKFLVARIRPRAGGWHIDVRELDCRTQTWQPPQGTDAVRTDHLPLAVGRAVVDAFTPIGLIGRPQGDTVEVIMRAGLLTGGARREKMVPPPGSVFRAVLRKTDRLGKLAENGLQPIPWTLLRVDENQFAEAHCQVVSGLRSPFRARTSRLVQKLAILVRPTHAETELRLVAQSDQGKPLTGYDVYYRLPQEKSTRLIGRSDWRGQLTVVRDADPIKILYIKNGGRLLARLPLVPGAVDIATAELVDDSARLEAEGFLTGLQEQMIEVMARRQVFAIRIRKALADQDVAKAERLLDELSDLPTKEELSRDLRQRQQRLAASNTAVQSRIDRMFRDTRALIQKHLSSQIVDELRREVLAAKSAT